MTETTQGKRYKFEFSGDFVECVTAPVPREKAEKWLSREPQALFLHAHGLDEDEADDTDIAYFGRASDIPGALFLEGCELNHGSLEIQDAAGGEIASLSLESEEFGEFIDDVAEIDIEAHLIDGGPTLITRTCYSGSATYEPQTIIESGEEAAWYVLVTDMGLGPFVSKLVFESEDVSPQASGLYGTQEVWLLVPDDEGNIRQMYHSENPQDD